MNEQLFWDLIEEAKNASDGDVDAQVEHLTAEVAKFAPASILEYNSILMAKFDESYRWDLWAVVYIIQGGCSDDGFDYFRGWLIAQGQDLYKKVLRDPRYLADLAEPPGECETIYSSGWDAYKQKTGEQIPADPHSTFKFEPDGRAWQEEELPDLYPDLWARFASD